MKKYINAKLKGKKELHEILIKDGKFENISAKPSYAECETIDLKGHLVILLCGSAYTSGLCFYSGSRRTKRQRHTV